jgi:hypothetical protein
MRPSRRPHERYRDRRTVTYGLVGALARRVTATDTTTHQSARPVAAENGAYLIVLPGPPEQHRALKVRTFYPNGLVCGRGGNSGPGCVPPPGYVAP